MIEVLSALLVTTLAYAEPPAPRSRAPVAPERIDAMLTSPARHVRGVGSAMTALIEAGARRSSTFARLLDTIEDSDVIVYVEASPGLPLSLAGRLLLVGSPKAQRYVRIQIAPGGTNDDQIAVLGHELQHAVEVAEAREVRDEPALAALYRRIGHYNGGFRDSFDTVAAREVGRTVRSELG